MISGPWNASRNKLCIFYTSDMASLRGCLSILSTGTNSCASTEDQSMNTATSLIWMLIAAAASITVWVYLAIPTWKVRKLPSPPAFWLLGHLPLLAKHGPDVFIHLARKYGPIYRFNFGRQPLVIIADADLCREVGIKKFKQFSNRSIPSPIASSPLHQKGLFFTRNSRWSSMRGAIQPLYQTGRISNLLPVMERVACVLKRKLATKEEGEDIDFSELLLRVATDIIGEAAFGERFELTEENTTVSSSNPSEVSEFIKQHVYSTSSLKMDLNGTCSILVGIMFPIAQEPFRQILSRIPGTGDWKVSINNSRLTDRLNAIVEKRKKDVVGNEKRVDFLSAVLGSRFSRELFSEEYITALTYEHLLAGSATTSFTISVILYLVSTHQDVQSKLLREIDEFGPPDGNPTAEDLDVKFPYLTQVIKEAMRFYTVSPLVAREASEPVQIGGYMLPKGTWVWMALNALAKDPRYFPEPELFNPERFDPECEEEKNRHPYANIPFGIGPRACIGMKFAFQEIKVVLINLYQAYTFDHSPAMENPLEFQFGIVVSVKYGVRLRLRHRRAQSPV